MGLFNQGLGGDDIRLGGFGQWSGTPRIPLGFQQQQFQSASTTMLYTGQEFAAGDFITTGTTDTLTIGGGSKPNSISCPECDKTLNYSNNIYGYGPCSCGHHEGDLTSKAWLESRIQEVTGS